MKHSSKEPGIIKLALPNIVTNITIPLLSMVDLHLMGYLSSEVYMGAVAMGNVIFNFVYWGFAFLRMSISGLAAQAYGAGGDSERAATLWRGLALAAIASLVLVVAQMPVVSLSLGIMDGSAEVKALAGDYFHIRIWSAPATIVQMVFFGWFLGMQNAFVPMLVSVVVNVVNIACSFFFVRYLGMDVDGVAWSAVVAHYVGVVLCIVFLVGKYRFAIALFNFRNLLVWQQYRSFLHVSGDIFIRTLCVIAVFTFFTSQSAGLGNVVLAANSALLQFLFFFAFFLDGFAYAAEAIVGRMVGAGQRALLKRTVWHLFGWGFGFALLFFVAYLAFADTLLGLMTNKAEVIDEAKQYVLWVAFIPLASFISFIWDGIYIGATASRAMRNTMLFSSVVFFFLPYYLLVDKMGNHAVWLSMVLFFAMRGVSQTWLASKAVFKE
jgi:multidrug resistance protein, MATE family